MALLVDIAGYIGMVLLLAAFALLTMKKLRADDWKYPLMNTIGAACVAVNSGYYGALPAAILNSAWFVIGLIGFIVARRRRGSAAPAEG